MGRTAITHIVLSVNFKPADIGLAVENVRIMLGLEAHAGPVGTCRIPEGGVWEWSGGSIDVLYPGHWRLLALIPAQWE